MRYAAALLGAAALVGCGAETPRGPEPTPAAAAAAAGLPAGCAPSVPARPVPPPAGFAVPAGTVLAGAPEPSGQLVQIQGFVTRTPSQAIADLLAGPGVTEIASEDEGIDAEVTITDGRFRTLYKLVRACAAGSRFTALRAPEPG